jgi:Holliday junction resolvasome RuvABC DNA-binding subunit
VKLPNDFVNKLSQTFKRKSAAMLLEDFGCEGRNVAPQVIGSLLGLQSMGAAQPIPTGQQAWSQELLISTLEGLGYSAKEAGEMFNRAAPNLRADHTFEKALRTVLQQAGKGE